MLLWEEGLGCQHVDGRAEETGARRAAARLPGLASCSGRHRPRWTWCGFILKHRPTCH